MVRFGTQPHQQLEDATASMLLQALFGEAPGVFGYFLAVAVTGTAPSKPRSSHGAPDLQQPQQPSERASSEIRAALRSAGGVK